MEAFLTDILLGSVATAVAGFLNSAELRPRRIFARAFLDEARSYALRVLTANESEARALVTKVDTFFTRVRATRNAVFHEFSTPSLDDVKACIFGAESIIEDIEQLRKNLRSDG